MSLGLRLLVDFFRPAREVFCDLQLLGELGEEGVEAGGGDDDGFPPRQLRFPEELIVNLSYCHDSSNHPATWEPSIARDR